MGASFRLTSDFIRLSVQGDLHPNFGLEGVEVLLCAGRL